MDNKILFFSLLLKFSKEPISEFYLLRIFDRTVRVRANLFQDYSLRYTSEKIVIYSLQLNLC